MTIHRCPHCNSRNLHCSRRRGVFENLVLLPFLLRPYRCHACTGRHYGFAFRERRASGAQPWEQRIRQARRLLGEPPLVGMPLLFASPGPELQKQLD